MAELTWAGFLGDLIATTLGAGLAVVIAWRVFKAESARMQKAEFAERERLQQAKFEEDARLQRAVVAENNRQRQFALDDSVAHLDAAANGLIWAEFQQQITGSGMDVSGSAYPNLVGQLDICVARAQAAEQPQLAALLRELTNDLDPVLPSGPISGAYAIRTVTQQWLSDSSKIEKGDVEHWVGFARRGAAAALEHAEKGADTLYGGEGHH